MNDWEAIVLRRDREIHKLHDKIADLELKTSRMNHSYETTILSLNEELGHKLGKLEAANQIWGALDLGMELQPFAKKVHICTMVIKDMWKDRDHLIDEIERLRGTDGDVDKVRQNVQDLRRNVWDL